MAPADTLEQHQHEVCNAFARAAVAMRDAANTAENFSNWFSRVNNLQNVPMPPTFNGASFNFLSSYGGVHPQTTAQVEHAGKKRKSTEEGDGKKKREKKPKDVNAPKRPPSPYILFQNEVRKQIQAKHPDITYAQVLSEIAKMWKEMSPEEKAPYQASQAQLKAKYEQEKADYGAKPEDGTKPKDGTKGAATKGAAAPVSKELPVESPAKHATGSSSDEASVHSSKESSESSEEEEEESEPEPPKKKSRKEVPFSLSAKDEKKKEKSEGKKKKKGND